MILKIERLTLLGLHVVEYSPIFITTYDYYLYIFGRNKISTNQKKGPSTDIHISISILVMQLKNSNKLTSMHFNTMKKKEVINFSK